MTARSVILGLDASARRIGWAVIDYDSARAISTGCAATAADDDLRQRRQAVKEIAHTAMGRGDVCAVFIEDVWAGPSMRGNLQHASAVGNVEAFALERWPDQLVARVAPSTWRKLNGIPARGKPPVAEWASAREPAREFHTQDEVDALAIATAGHYLIWQAGATTDAAYPTTRSQARRPV